ncbi:hypothetical protein [Paractinoplanes atraurantiacus]|uniref:Uncharacterized protein n=1 Tax=Paractinoplanes atraurantiacus TaxID=1036182 RepID=A0A285HU06_9ACTN|nr:hypothetical protein [Actinoplanes atraurantiacus]SNY39113.1 hypothetical protein SAMN05421748_105310 [Actinoplanes atraurantiacus]
MDDLSAMLRGATDNPPPSSIDLDRMIRGERRRKTRRAAAVGSMLAVVTVMAGVAWVVRSPQRPAPATATPPAPAPTSCLHPTNGIGGAARTARPVRPLPEAHDVAARRLTAALTPLLPDGAHPEPGSGCDRVEFFWNRQAAVYQATAWQGAGEKQVSTVILVRAAEPSDATPRCLGSDGPECTRTDLDGERTAMSDLNPVSEGTYQRSVTLYRPDDTRVSVVVIGRPAVLPSVEQLTVIAGSADLTLYP